MKSDIDLAIYLVQINGALSFIHPNFLPVRNVRKSASPSDVAKQTSNKSTGGNGGQEALSIPFDDENPVEPRNNGRICTGPRYTVVLGPPPILYLRPLVGTW